MNAYYRQFGIAEIEGVAILDCLVVWFLSLPRFHSSDHLLIDLLTHSETHSDTHFLFLCSSNPSTNTRSLSVFPISHCTINNRWSTQNRLRSPSRLVPCDSIHKNASCLVVFFSTCWPIYRHMYISSAHCRCEYIQVMLCTTASCNVWGPRHSRTRRFYTYSPMDCGQHPWPVGHFPFKTRLSVHMKFLFSYLHDQTSCTQWITYLELRILSHLEV